MKKSWMILRVPVAAFGLILIAMPGTLSGPAHAQTAKDLVGTWQHVANVNIATDGKKTDTFGPNPKGMAIFSADGHFMIINLRSDLPKIAANSRVQGTADENASIVRGSIALYGTYSVPDKAINLKIEASTYPNWSGTESKRNILIYNGDEMKWSLAASMGGQSQSEVTWKRMK
ncbi:MAG: lipocalin-like domain-containing protein [Acidobacteriota bacterium]|nr:lipocalin-like domain-containing protein [Acidobacteriota bacterium]